MSKSVKDLLKEKFGENSVMYKLPIKEFNGDFNCSNTQLTSLEGSPKVVNGYFICSSNELTSLEGCPTIVNGNFSCSNNNLTSLEGAPEIVNGKFSCRNQKSKKKFTRDEVRKVCKVKNMIYVV